MNMISTGAFQTEMDASSKQSTLAKKFAAVWEKKNAKAARAGGVSLMALSLAACGSDDATTTTATTTTTTTDTTTTTTTVAGQSLTLTKSGTTDLDSVTGGAGDDTITAAGGRMNDGDTVDGGLGSDTLTATVDGSADAYIDGVEVINIKALGATASLNGVRISGTETINVSGAGTLTVANGAAGIKYSVADAGTSLTVTQTGTDATTNSTTVTLGAGKLGTVTMGDASGVDFETVNLIIGGDGSATFTEANTASFADAGDSIVVTGSGDYTLLITDGSLGSHATAGSQTAATIDASGHTGKLTIDLDALTTTNNVGALNYTGVDAIRIETAAANSDVNIITKVASGTEIIVGEIESANNSLTVTQSGTASNDTLTITLNDEDKGGTIDLTTLTTDGFESLTINSTGTDLTSATGVVTAVANVVDSIAGLSTDPNLTITGDKLFTSTGIESTYTNIDVTATGGTNLTVAAGGALDYSAAGGNDRLVLDTIADITAADSLNGGDGTDTLAISALLATDFSAAQLATISNFEILEYTGAQDMTSGTGTAVDLTKLTGINTLKMAGDISTDNANVFTITADDGFTLVAGGIIDGQTATSNFVVSIKNAANAGTNNTVNYNITNVDGNDDASAGFTIDNVENLVISMTGDGDADNQDTMTVADIDGAQLQTLTVKSTNTGVSAANKLDGSDDLIITALETTTLTSLDASAMTGDFTLTDTSAFAAVGATVKGGSAVDTITTGAGADTITGGAGADVLKGSAGNDSISGDAGNDNIAGNAGADTLTGGTGDNTFVIIDAESVEAGYDVIKDFTAGAADADFDTLDIVLANDTVFATVAKASAHNVANHTTETETGTVSAYVTNGVIQLTGTQTSTVDTLAEWIDIAEDTSVNLYVDNGGNDAGAETVVVAFEFSGSTYVVAGDDGDSDNTYATEYVVQLEGLTGVTAISLTEAANTIHVA